MAVPVRTCLGCGRKADKAALVRLVLATDQVVVDSRQRLPGRGVYCCRQAACYQRLMKQRKKLAWALRCQDAAKAGALAVGVGLDAVFTAS